MHETCHGERPGFCRCAEGELRTTSGVCWRAEQGRSGGVESEHMPEEVAPHIYRLAIPLPDSRLSTVNAYAVLNGDAVRLVDCGWNTPEAYEALKAELSALGPGIAGIREIVVTHIHPDHFGLAGRVAEESGARVLMHRLDGQLVGARYADTRALIDEMEVWLRLNGVPADELAAMTEGSLGMLRWVDTRRPDVLLEGGERLAWEPYRFEVIFTPGHSAGLICLFDRESGVLLSSDHVLQRISPHVGLHVQSSADPLGAYLDSLRAMHDLPVTTVLPGHGKPFSDLAGRVDQLLEHHAERLDTIRATLAGGPATAHDLAARLTWRGAEDGWATLEPFQRRMALTETIAHLEHLLAEGRVKREELDGRVLYTA